MHPTKLSAIQRNPSRVMILVAGATMTMLAARPARADQAKFASPQLALRALVAAAAKDDTARMREIFGPVGDPIVSSGDLVKDAADRKWFVTRARERVTFEPIAGGAVVAHLGKEDWPFPVPLEKDGADWRFDAAAGKQELLNRRIGANEFVTIDVCHAYVDAQREYAKVDRTGAGVRTYATKLHSEAGKKDGLHWDDPTGRDESPLGPLVAQASAEGYGSGQGEGPIAYHGYLYRILTAQGAKAPGGAKSYLKDGKLVGGFALLAYPAEYGNSGVMTFVVNQDGVVFQKNLGEQTAELAKAITVYDPDDTWDAAR